MASPPKLDFEIHTMIIPGNHAKVQILIYEDDSGPRAVPPFYANAEGLRRLSNQLNLVADGLDLGVAVTASTRKR
jgi:hypothetical protein